MILAILLFASMFPLTNFGFLRDNPQTPVRPRPAHGRTQDLGAEPPLGMYSTVS